MLGIEHIQELVDLSKSNLNSYALNYQIAFDDGRTHFTTRPSYSAIHVGCAAATLPQKLVDSLLPNGRMVIPIGPEYGEQELFMIDKDENGKVHQKVVMSVKYVPLTDAKRQLSSY